MKLNTDYNSGDADESFFDDLYDEHGVEMVGQWINVENPRELYFITGYEDEDHYKSFTSAMQDNEDYQKYTEELSKYRESIEVVTLREIDD